MRYMTYYQECQERARNSAPHSKERKVEKGRIKMGEKLKAARQAAGMTQGQLAEAIGCRVKDISRWENGHVEPGVLTVKKMAQALGCSMDDLV